jgi:hypothetical protein
MANVLYDSGREGFLDGTIDWDTDTIKVVLVDTGVYTFSAAHKFRSSSSAGEVSTAQTLGTKTVTAGVADAADSAFPSVSGATVEALIIYKDNGSAAADRLIAFIDSATGLPVTPNGGNINVQWDSGANRIFKL